ncbi:MAG: hypothetical protein Q9213_007657 [Squamulea squamosa]
MKDLYTFDATSQEAKETYDKACAAYKNFFDELQIPYLVAKADSGAIGGDLSHEYQFPTTSGEDTIVSCESCSYTVNEELARKPGPGAMKRITTDCAPHKSWFGVSKDRSHLVEAILPQVTEACEISPLQQGILEVDPYLMRTLYPELDLGVEDPLGTFVAYWMNQPSTTTQAMEPLPLPQLTRIYDYRISQAFAAANYSRGGNKIALMEQVFKLVGSKVLLSPTSLDLARFKDGDQCPECKQNTVKMQQAIELGHTFYLGDRYSKPMDATFTTSPSQRNNNETAQTRTQSHSNPAKLDKAYFQMGCHGIGISRMIAAVADSLADKQGLRWPRVMAPFEAAILATEENKGAAEEVWDLLARPTEGWNPLDAVLDDRDDKGLGWKLKDADLIGFPIVVILGSQFSKQGLCEISIPRLQTKEKVEMGSLREYIGARLDKI